jgi:tetratricopeptide (TPR) repeat protein
MADIFLSYAADDRERVRPLVAFLEAEGWSVWWDRQIAPGEVWDREIEEAVELASCVIVVWSQASVASDWVRSEANEGLSRHRLVPVLIDNVRPPMVFRSIQSSFLIGWPSRESQRELFQLLATVRKIVEGEGPAELSRREQKSSELNVTHLLEGSVRKSGERLRIHVQCSRTDDGFQLWSESYDRTLGDIFAIQDDIAKEVVTRLQIGFMGQMPSSRQTDSTAYALYLQANHIGYQQTDGGSGKAIGLFQRALEIDGSYVAAWVGLARMYLNEAALGQRPFAQGHQLAESALRKALSLVPDDPNAQCTMAGLRFDENNVVDAVEHLHAGLSPNTPNENSLSVVGDILSCLGEEGRAIDVHEFVSSRDPVNPSVFGNLASAYYLAGRWQDAIRALDVVESLSPNALGINALRAIIYVMRRDPGDRERALACAERETFDGFRLEAMTIVRHSREECDESSRSLSELVNDCGEDWAYNIARAHAFRGELEEAFSWLQKAVDAGDSGLAQARVDPVLMPLRANDEWEPLLATIGLSTQQLSMLNLNFQLPL